MWVLSQQRKIKNKTSIGESWEIVNHILVHNTIAVNNYFVLFIITKFTYQLQICGNIKKKSKDKEVDSK